MIKIPKFHFFDRKTNIQSLENKIDLTPPIGPDITGSFFHTRPYYLVHIDPIKGKGYNEEDLKRIVEKISSGHNEVTDIFVFCHGWHRHAWEATAAYDRFFARMPRLEWEGRTSTPQNRPYFPLFIGVHWKSKIGTNAWTPKLHLKDRESFIRRVQERFLSDRTALPLIIDRLFEYFTLVTLAGENAKLINDITELKESLDKNMDSFRSSTHGNNHTIDRMLQLYDCFLASDDIKTVTDQSGSTNNLLQSYIKKDSNASKQHADGKFSEFLKAARGSLILLFLFAIISLFKITIISNALYLIAISGLIVAVLISLQIIFDDHYFEKSGLIERFVVTVLQLIFSIPLFAWIIVSFSCGPVLHYALRKTRKSSSESNSHTLWTISRILACFAQIPTRLWSTIKPNIDSPGTIISIINSQFSFWDMQQQAPLVGRIVANFLLAVFSDSEKQSRVHFIGHSFGGSVVANAVRHLSKSKSQVPCTSLCLLLPALHSHWLKQESEISDYVTETLSCIFSKHDSANGIYYPLANQGRNSAGYNGFEDCNLEDWIAPPGASSPRYINLHSNEIQKHTINMDATLVINQGNTGNGGAHNDIFKDEVFYLIWQLTVGASIHINPTD